MTDQTGIAGMLVADKENDERERRWTERHAEWSRVYWPSYLGGPFDRFRVYLIADRTVMIQVGSKAGRKAFLRALEDACIAGTCGVDHSGDPVF